MASPVQQAALSNIAYAWQNVQEAQEELAKSRQIFLDLLTEAQRAGCTQEEMASVCLTDKGHISRSRISQYILEIRNNNTLRRN